MTLTTTSSRMGCEPYPIVSIQLAGPAGCCRKASVVAGIDLLAAVCCDDGAARPDHPRDALTGWITLEVSLDDPQHGAIVDLPHPFLPSLA
ncbi:MAG TPA: hypothetical protein VFS21_20300 [Roseiflexaceae bacterium]|nr:hypothetical protein [Roseiflexaceae bacterium]